ncbi:MAG: hypothetical protein GF411_03955 [Candidatus Lokiarchaeota archaeon]|nr:hypothetical protein [Candidatus Lokiarchaeota archaeon]
MYDNAVLRQTYDCLVSIKNDETLTSRKIKNRLNELDGKEWVKLTKSWFIVNPPARTRRQLEHPAKFPEKLVERFVKFFTNKGDWVLDPFGGVGSTGRACKNLDRNAFCIELNSEFVEIGQHGLEKKAEFNQYLVRGDSLEIEFILGDHFGPDIPNFDYLVTSPPYWNMLRKSRGGNETTHKERGEQGLKQHYSESDRDLGNIEGYQDYLDNLYGIFEALFPFLHDKAYLTVIVQNMRDVDGTLRPIAWDLAKKLSDIYKLQQEMIWCQDNKRLGCWGFPTTYVSNVHHHYCLIFQKTK